MACVVSVASASLVWRCHAADFHGDPNGNLTAQSPSVAGKPRIVSHPRDALWTPGGAARFTVLASGSGPLQYRWRRDGTPIPGADGEVLTLSGLAPSPAGLGSFDVEVSNAEGSALSRTATLWMDEDGDGLADAWERERFGDLAQGPVGDGDGDGFSNLDEWIAGSDPKVFEYHLRAAGAWRANELGPEAAWREATFWGGTVEVRFHAAQRRGPFRATGLPEGVALDPATGRLSGVSKGAGSFLIEVSAPTALGPATGRLQLSVLDPEPDKGIGSEVRTALPFPGGRLIFGGLFPSLLEAGGSRIALLDAQGKGEPGFRASVETGAVNAVAVQPDGRVWIGGTFAKVGGVAINRLARLKADGTLDPGFTLGVYGSEVHAIVPQPDGKVIVAGEFTRFGGSSGPVRNRLLRLNADGTLDAGFNPNASNAVNCIAVQEDGRILVGGEFLGIGGKTRLRLARLLSNGEVDPSLDIQFRNKVTSIVLQPDGKILVAGQFDFVLDPVRGENQLCQNIARIHPDGRIDLGFRGNVEGAVQSLCLQTDGRILVGGSFDRVEGVVQQGIVRLQTDGTRDRGFLRQAPGTVNSVALCEDGRLVLGGTFVLVPFFSKLATLPNDAFPAREWVFPGGSEVEWRRGGGLPEVSDVAFELWNGNSWVPLARPKRVSGGWRASGLTLPPEGTLRARARVAGGYHASSSSILEETQAFVLPKPPSLLAPSVTLAGAGYALLGAEVLADGGSPILEQGFVWSTSTANPLPTVGGSGVDRVAVIAGLGPFSEVAYGLSAGTEYVCRAYARNGAGVAHSAPVVFTTDKEPSLAPAITLQPQSATVAVGQSVEFVVAATGAAPLSYQWQRNGINLAGATGATLTIPNVQAGDAGDYRVIVTNAAGSVSSVTVSLAVGRVELVLGPPGLDGRLTLEFVAGLGRQAILEVSTDLGNWAEAQRVTGQGPTTPVRVTLTPRVGVAVSFWRLRATP